MLGKASLLALLLASGVGSTALAQDTSSKLLAQSPFDAETRNLMASLPCTWAAMGGRTGPSYGAERFDFVCKGGTWGTVTLLLDASDTEPPFLTRLRLGYRNTAKTHPVMAQDAATAEHFLQSILNRYVPSTDAARARKNFWEADNSRSRTNGITTRTWAERNATGTHQWLEIQFPERFKAAPRPERPPITVGSGLLTPTPQGATVGQPMVQVPLLPKPTNTRGAAPKTLLDKLGNLVGISATEIRPAPYPVLIDPAQLNTEPAPESLVSATPPPVVSSTLVPDAAILSGGRAPAPTNFNQYNKAEDLTRDIEQKAAQTTTGLMQKASPTVPVTSGPRLQAVPTPQVNTGLQNPAPQTQAPAQPDPRYTPNRALPQLKFIPKAEPLNTAPDVIRFEDEGSGL